MAAIRPPYVITEDDKQGLIVVFTAVTLSFVWVCFGIRIWIKCRSIECWKPDDYFLAGATMLDTAQSAVVFHAVNAGLGKSLSLLSPSDLQSVGQNELAAQILYIVSLLFSKCAILFLYLRLSPHRRHTSVSWATIIFSVAWSVASAVLIVLPCSPLGFWRYGSRRCSHLWPRWQAISAIDIFTEAVIIFISVFLVAHLNMRRKGKIMVVAAFSARLPVVVAAAFRLHYLHATLDSTDRTLDGSYYAIATQWHLGYAIMSTTITGLGPFLRPFSKSTPTSCHYSSSAHQHSQASKEDSHGKSRAGSKDEAYQMHPMQPCGVSTVTPADQHIPSTPGPSDNASSSSQSPALVLRPDLVRRNTLIIGGEMALDEEAEEYAASRTSRESQQWIIMKKTELTVETDQLSAVSTSQPDDTRHT